MTKFLSALIFLGLLSASPAYAVTRYLDNGSTGCSNPDTDYEPTTRTCGAGSATVYNTLAGVQAVTASGDTILAQPGTYAEQIFNFPSGATLQGYDSVKANWPLFRPTAGANGAASTVWFNASRSGVTFRYLKFDASAISGASACFRINDGPVVTFTLEHFTCPGPSGATAFDTAGGITIGRDVVATIRYGTISSWKSADGNPGAHGFYWRGSNGLAEHVELSDYNGKCLQYQSSTYVIQGNIFRNNICRDMLASSTEDGALYIADGTGGGSGNQAYNNIIFNVRKGIDARGTNHKIYNNTVLPELSTASSGSVGIDVDTCFSGCVAANNIVLTADSAIPSPHAGTTLTTNRTSGTLSAILIDAPNGNFSPIESSVAIDAGTSIAGFSSGRFVGSAPDQGALEAPIRSGAVVQDGDHDNYLITFILASQSVRGGVGLQTATVANYAIVVAGAGATESTATITGTNRVDVDLAANVTNGQSLTDAYTRGTLTDNVCIGDPNTLCRNASVRTYAALTGTNEVGAAPSGGFEVVHYRCLSWYAGTTPVATDWRRAEDSALNCPVRPGGRFAIAIAVARNTDATVPVGLDWYANRAAGAFAAMTNTPTATTIAFAAQSAPSMADLAAIPAAILTDPHTNYIPGAVVAQQASQPTIPFEADSTSNVIILGAVHADTAVGDVYCIQPALAGLTVSSVTQTETGCVEIVNPSAGS